MLDQVWVEGGAVDWHQVDGCARDELRIDTCAEPHTSLLVD